MGLTQSRNYLLLTPSIDSPVWDSFSTELGREDILVHIQQGIDVVSPCTAKIQPINTLISSLPTAQPAIAPLHNPLGYLEIGFVELVFLGLGSWPHHAQPENGVLACMLVSHSYSPSFSP